MMYHWIGVSVFMMAQYLFVYFTFGFYYSCFKKYEQDLETNKALIIKVDTKHHKEYEHLMQENDED